ncbi:MAG: holo-ACP synthase [Coriobacteriales bacterium]|jgi:holo-[acyl-carrier protein] synthase|nr:holo-ACP synthase [Coriobacteriales bacterium]
MARLSKKNQALLRATKRQSLDNPLPIQGSGVGLGVDIIEIDRMQRAIERTPRILQRVFSSGEREYAWSKSRPASHYALFFAAKEAVLKALGTGFTGMRFTDVEVAHDDKGKPIALLHGNVQAEATSQGIVEIQLSLSHTHQVGVASAVAIKDTSRPVEPLRLDPQTELSRQFKELRAILDSLDQRLEQQEQSTGAQDADAQEAGADTDADGDKDTDTGADAKARVPQNVPVLQDTEDTVLKHAETQRTQRAESAL